jgi:hypothetical protein
MVSAQKMNGYINASQNPKPPSPLSLPPAPLNRAAKVNIFLFPASVSKKIFKLFFSPQIPPLSFPHRQKSTKEHRQSGCKDNASFSIFPNHFNTFFKENLIFFLSHS